jgi:formylglycine-generating enzyme required for sulfatase activity
MKTYGLTLMAAMLAAAATTTTTIAADDAAAMKKLKAKDWTVPGVGMEMKLIPAGTFTMGSPKDEICRRDDEVQHTVTISKPFYMAAFECRQREFYKLMKPEDYDYEKWTAFRGPIHEGTAYTYRFPLVKGAGSSPVGFTYPMDMLNWNQAVEFCGKLTEEEKKAGRLPDGYVYRLPTEAEWEYACRAGTKGPYSFDDYNNPAVVMRHMYAGTGGDYTFGVGDTVSKRKPNAWGLYDMYGNVWEWCLDWYGPYENRDQSEPAGPAAGEKKVVRGGSCMPWFSDTEKFLNESVHPFCRSAARYSFKPTINCLITTGFRAVLAPEVGGK